MGCIAQRRLASGLMLVAVFAASAGAAAAESACAWLDGSLDAGLAPDPALLDASPTRHRQLPLFRQLMQQPLAAPCRVSGLLGDVHGVMASPHELYRWAAGLGSIETLPDPALPADVSGPESGVDPLATGLAWMRSMADATGSAWTPTMPDYTAVPEPLRTQIGRQLAAIGRARRLLEQALARLPPRLTPPMLRQQLMHVAAAPDQEADLRRLLSLLDRQALATGMVELVAATERLQRFLVAAANLPRITWWLDTPLGAVVVDTTGRDNTHRLAAPLLLLDVGGNDSYEFESAPAAGHVGILLDHGGDDRYRARAAGADPSAATLGYGILWDTAGADTYEGRDFAQAASLFGAALLVDDGGANRFAAASHAQGYALGGIALLLASAGGDEYVAQTHAQASAGPEATAVLIDRGGDDRYTLENTPLSRPSPQLPTHNTSMGQGAGRGLRARSAADLSAAGGIGMLIDLAGNDRYAAQVFAQGAGYHEGVGVLIDAGGADRFDAAWYAMGAAAHQAAGVLLKLGTGNDRYRATHSTSLGAAHDLSVAAFLDEGGDDDYMLGDLGLGASHDDGVGLFVDLAGADHYHVAAAVCRAFGFDQSSSRRAVAARSPRLGLFVDRDRGGDRLPGTCPRMHGAGAPAR